MRDKNKTNEINLRTKNKTIQKEILTQRKFNYKLWKIEVKI